MDNKYLVTKLDDFDVSAASGSRDFGVPDAAYVSIVAKLKTLTGGTTPSVDIDLVGVDEFNNEFPLINNSALTDTTTVAAGNTSTSQVVPNEVRLKWATTGAPTVALAQVCIYARTQ